MSTAGKRMLRNITKYLGIVILHYCKSRMYARWQTELIEFLKYLSQGNFIHTNVPEKQISDAETTLN